MTPKRASYTFITIPSPLVVSEAPEIQRSGTSVPSPSAAACSHDGTHSPAAAAATQSVVAAAAASTAVAAERGTTGSSAAAAAASTSGSTYAAVTSSAIDGAAATSPCRGAAAATPPAVVGVDAEKAAAAPCKPRRARGKAAMSVAPSRTDALAEALKSCSQSRLAPLHERSDSGSSEGQQQQSADNRRPTVAAAISDTRAAAMTTSSCVRGAASAATQQTSSPDHHNGPRSEPSSMASSVSTAYGHSPFFLPRPSQFTPDSSSSSSSSFSSSSFSSSSWRSGGSSCHSNVTRTGESTGRAAAPSVAEKHSAEQQISGNKEGQNGRSSGVVLPSFADAQLPPLAVEDTAVMLREFAALLQRLEYSGQQALQQQKQPQHTRARDGGGRHRLSPQEQLQQQAVVCASLSARLERLFDAGDACSAQPALPGSPEASPASAADSGVSPKKRHQLMLPGVRSRAGIQESASGEEDWPEHDGSSQRIALRTLGTLSTLGSTGSVSFELTQAYSPPRTSLEIHRGRLRLAKLKEDFERLQQKHERLVTLFNIRMLLPLSRRRRSGRSYETSIDSTSSPTQAVPDASSREKQQSLHPDDTSTTTKQCVSPSSSCSSRNENLARGAAEAGGTPASRLEGAAAARDSRGFLGNLDFSHFAGDWGAGNDRDSTAAVAGFARSRRRHSSSLISCSRSLRFPSGGVGGAYTPLRNLLRYTSTSSSSSGGGVGGSPQQHGLPRSSLENGFGSFFSFNDTGSVSFGDSLPPIHMFSRHEREKDKPGDAAGLSSLSQGKSSLEGRQQQQQLQWETNNSRRKSAAGTGFRWRRGDSSVLFPGEASLENVWKPTRLQEVDEGFEEQQRREQLEQLQHIEECVHVLQELHVQIADEVEASEEPLATVAAETDAAAEQTAQANRELVTASLRRSRWWGVQGGGVAAAAGVVVGGLAGGPIGAAVGLLCGAFIGATSGSALEREHRHKLLRLTRDRTRRRKPPSREGEQQTQLRSASVPPALGADLRQTEYRGEQELVRRPRELSTTTDRETSADGDRRGRTTSERQRPQSKCSTQQQNRGTAVSPQKEDAAVTTVHDGRAQEQQRRKADLRRHRQPRFSQRENAFRDSREASRSSSSSTAVTRSSGTAYSRSTAGAVRSSAAVSTEAAISARTVVCTDSSSGKEAADAHGYLRQGGDERLKRTAAQRKREKLRSPNVPLPALLGWGGSSVLQQADRHIRGRAAGRQSRTTRSTPN